MAGQDIRLELIQAAADIGKAAATAYVRSRHVGHRADPAPQRVTVVDVGLGRDGCPYCAVAKHLASAHLYLSRLFGHTLHGETESIYVDLTLGVLDDALLILYRSDRGILKEDRVLKEQIENLQASLSLSIRREDTERLIGMLWNLANRALLRAETTRGE